MAKKIYSIFMIILVSMLFLGFYRADLLAKVSLLAELSLTFLLLMISFSKINVSNLLIKVFVVFGIAYEIYYNLIYISFEVYSMIGLMIFIPLYTILIRFSFKKNNSEVSF